MRSPLPPSPFAPSPALGRRPKTRSFRKNARFALRSWRMGCLELSGRAEAERGLRLHVNATIEASVTHVSDRRTRLSARPPVAWEGRFFRSVGARAAYVQNTAWAQWRLQTYVRQKRRVYRSRLCLHRGATSPPFSSILLRALPRRAIGLPVTEAIRHRCSECVQISPLTR